jgi:hypothetical protein
MMQAHWGGDFTDGVYIPARLAADFQLASMPFREERVFHELAVPAILGFITDGPHDFEVFKPIYYWNRRDQIMANTSLVLQPGGLAFDAFLLHPYKLSKPGAREHFWAWWEQLSCDAATSTPRDWNGTLGVWARTQKDRTPNVHDAHGVDADGRDLPWWSL